ncbi:glycerol-3-phosphate 1-O-acyltransferase PlsY [Caproiciproducens galactitolivorans]|uniref:Glycerol-3-phosphate acyltransferase n=1 Tax=Caproiciproducens galactitolivorans TaxID=642589 RepID=A0A4Z0XYT3_9FIRM|nr:glycerol-3-phosphate 1-O-acyltransferase PlsY [Caproiciproducens galactitolivorans]QEY34018.1 glycerol-3-phosphate 1-O-acyltransferase PlsY [Caproiciproducens galactitolivorans]TGJ76574.1 glycerol-3-phosphate acyltransferase [Caproiciproducens galactitolivorans]
MFGYVKDFALPTVIVAIISYLLGSISFSIIFTKLFNKVDIRTMGSGNAGATNVLRSVGTKAAIFTFIFDFLKGAISVIIGKAVFGYFCDMADASLMIVQYGAYIAGMACVIGHIYPIYFGFKGGKGVLTSAAMIALIDWRVFIVVISIFIIVFLITRIVSLSSMLAAGSFPIATFLITYFLDYRSGSLSPEVTLTYVWVTSVIALIMALTIIYEHRSNIERIKNGTEKKLTINHKS